MNEIPPDDLGSLNSITVDEMFNQLSILRERGLGQTQILMFDQRAGAYAAISAMGEIAKTTSDYINSPRVPLVIVLIVNHDK